MGNEALNRLRRLKQTPLYRIHSWQLNWASYPERAKIADQMSWLGPTSHDIPIRRAFDFFLDLDERDPRHWRILITYLSMALFPNPKKGVRIDTILKNAELLMRCESLPDKYRSDDTIMLNQILKKYPKDYGGKIQTTKASALRNLRRRLRDAREERAKDNLLRPFEKPSGR